MQTLTYVENGISFIENFISHADILKLRAEAMHLFSATQLLGPGFCVRLSKTLCELPNPAAKIQSINLLETAIDIQEVLIANGLIGYKLAHVALYHEKENSKPLHWHSDVRNGNLIRAQICIEGGQKNSGAFMYMKDSHKLDITMDNWEPSKEWLAVNRQNEVTCDRPNGTLVIFNTLGYHAKAPCNELRVSLMFDFLTQDYLDSHFNDCASEISLTSSRLSAKVLANIDLFNTHIPTTIKAHNTSESYKFFKPFSGANIGDLWAMSRPLFGKVLEKIKRNLSK